MRTNTLSKSLCLMLSVICLLSFTVKAQKFRAYVLNPPEKTLDGVGRIAVLNFGNLTSAVSQEAGVDLGTKMADYLIAELLMDHRGADPSKTYIKGARTNIYDLIERSQLDQVLKEQKLEASGVVDDNQAVEIGKLLGLDAIVTGSLSYVSEDKQSLSTSKDNKGVITYTYTISRIVNTEARMKIISVKTAQILGTKDFRNTQTDSQSSGKGYLNFGALKPPYLLADQSFKDMAGSFANYFTPHFIYETFDLKNIKAKEYKDRADEAEKFLKRGDINNAYKIYKAMFDVDSYNPQVAYNLGIIYEATGDYDQASELYSAAYQIDQSDKDYAGAYKRIASLKTLVKQLAAMGINVEKYEFTEGGSEILSKKLVTKGNSNDRVPAYEQPNTSSNKVANVPGGLSFSIVEKEGEFYKVNLVGGKVGYFYAKDVKAEN